MSYIEKEKLIKADIASIENRVRHAFNQGYDLGYKDGKISNLKGVGLIDRKMAIEGAWDTELAGLDNKKIVDMLKNLPPATPQKSKTGHWIDSSNGWMCSVCKTDNTFDTNYCPNCGCRMVEPQESENP